MTCEVHRHTTFTTCPGCVRTDENAKREKALANVVPEFRSVTVTPKGEQAIGDIRLAFDRLWREIHPLIHGSKRCHDEVRNKLEEASMWAVKGVSISHQPEAADVIGGFDPVRAAKGIR